MNRINLINSIIILINRNQKRELMIEDWTSFEFCSIDNIPKERFPCIYFLFNKNELVYIGETLHLKPRIRQQIKKFNCSIYIGDSPLWEHNFNCLYYKLASTDSLKRKREEALFKKKYAPKLNGFNMEFEAIMPFIMIKRFINDFEKGEINKDRLLRESKHYMYIPMVKELVDKAIKNKR